MSKGQSDHYTTTVVSTTVICEDYLKCANKNEAGEDVTFQMEENPVEKSIPHD